MGPALPDGVNQSRGSIHTQALTDDGNAQRLVAQHGHLIRYVPHWGRWMTWDGRRWARDETGRVVELAKETIRALARQPRRQATNGLASHASRSQSAGKISAMVTLARTDPAVVVSPGQLDQDKWLLNVSNGTLDLRTGTLREHRPGDLITKLAPVEYRLDPVCPTWDAFLKESMAGDDEMQRFLQRTLGCTLTGDTSEQAMFVLHGSGANGKSTCLNTVRAILGDYAMDTPSDTLLVKRFESIPNDLARLHGARFVTAMETEQGKQLGGGRIQQLTGGDPLTARFLYGEYFEYMPQFKLFVATNHRPRIRGTDNAIWRRIHLIPFDVAIPPERQDHVLGEKLLAEAPGILRWMVEGCLAWQHQGLGPPSKVRQATTAYRAEEDRLAAFLMECCENAPDGRVPTSELYAAYAGWCAQTGEVKESQKNLGAYLEDHGYTSGKSGPTRHWKGLRLRSDRQGDSGTDGTH